MAFGAGGGSPDEVKGDINVTPLVDVCLVLLIIFMVVTPMLQYGRRRPAAAGSARGEEAGQGRRPDHLDQAGRHGLHRAGLDSRSQTSRTYLKAEHDKNPARAVMLKADKRINFGKVRMVMKAANEAEFTGVSILTENQQAGAQMAQGRM